MGPGAVVMAHGRKGAGAGGGDDMGAHLGPAPARPLEQLVHHVAARRLIDLHLMDHVGKPAVHVRALPVARRMIHDRHQPRQRMGDGRINQRHGLGVGNLAAQVQQVIGAEGACRLPLGQRRHQRLQDLAPLGPFHRGADRQAVEDRRRAARDDDRIMRHQRGQKGPEHVQPRMGVTLHMVGVQIDHAGDEKGPAKVDPVRSQRQARDPAAFKRKAALGDAAGGDDAGIRQRQGAAWRGIEHGKVSCWMTRVNGHTVTCVSRLGEAFVTSVP